jgi:hypothetical protein
MSVVGTTSLCGNVSVASSDRVCRFPSSPARAARPSPMKVIRKAEIATSSNSSWVMAGLLEATHSDANTTSCISRFVVQLSL